MGLKPGSELDFFTTISRRQTRNSCASRIRPTCCATPVDDTINYGFLQSTDTQKALFLTPAFEQGVQTLFSKTPPLFVDAFRIVNSKAIFPNIGDAVTQLRRCDFAAQERQRIRSNGPERCRARRCWC